MRRRMESVVKRVLYSESALNENFSSPHPFSSLPPPGKDNVFLQQLINDRMTDSMVLSKEAESHC